MSEKPKSKRILLPPTRQKNIVSKSSVVLLPELSHVLDDACHIVGTELAKMKRRSEVSSSPMDPETARLFQGYVKAAVDLSKETRERDKEDESGDFSDKELLDMFLDSMPKEEVVRLLQDKINGKAEKQVDIAESKEVNGDQNDG